MKLDYLIGYSIHAFGKHDGKPAMVFENGVTVTLPSAPKKQKIIVGERLTNVEDCGEGVRLYFNENYITVEKGKYRIVDPKTGEEFDPHAEVDVNADLPPDPSADRIQEGSTPDAQNEEV